MNDSNRLLRAGQFLALLFGLALLGAVAADGASAPEQLRVLFLGDAGLHQPAERFKQLEPALAARGIELVYTDRLEDLNLAKLAGFDCLAIFANHARISPDQETALLDFVARGGGLAAIHCASYCFLNSPKYIELVGAQFKSHGIGVFEETIIKADHPVMKGLTPLESWDETYVHEKHNINRVVLAERRDAGRAEPYTWAREHGWGRVFYTAWGHDQRTWSQAGFQALVENGIRWASEGSPSRLKPRGGLKPFEFVEAPSPLPNYTPGKSWGTQGEAIRTLQKPLSPEESKQHLVTPPGFAASLFAAEPDIIKPICMAWDERGRLWIAETVDYPNELQPPGQGRDRIKICEDTDGDGRADKFTVFADNLSIPTSFVFAKGGIIVVHSGETLFLKDTNGDDQADVRTVLFTGWGMGDTHATVSNLRWGFDNWIWGTVGYSGFNGTVGGKAMRFSQGFFRFKPDGSALEFVRSSNNNTWGLGLSEEGLIFGSTANGNASMFMPIPNRYYEAVNGWSASVLGTIADSQKFYPLTDKVRQVDWHGKYTAGAGSALYTARNFPKEYWNRIQFVAEPTGHLLGKFHLEARGADFVAHNGRNFLASDDEWTAPIAAEVGPEGALWVIDWYNYIIQHNPTPQGFKTGHGNAYETPLRDKVHGRILRITWDQAKPAPKFNLAKASPQDLVATLKSDNLLWRMTAQRRLVERGQNDVVPALIDMVRDRKIDAIGLNTAAIHALCTLNGLSALDGSDSRATAAATSALTHPSAGVRRTAVSVLPRTQESRSRTLESNLLEDPDAQVRLAALLALSEMPSSNDAGARVFAMLQRPQNAGDRWIADGAAAAGARHDAGFIKAVLASSLPAPEAKSVTQIVMAHYAHRGPVDTILPTLAALKGASAGLTVPILDGLISGWPQDRVPALGEFEKTALTGLMKALPESARDRLLALAQRWGRPDLFAANVAAITGTLRKQIADPALPEDQRVSAAQRLIGLDDRIDNVQWVLQPITLLTPSTLATGLINALAGCRNPQTGQALVGHWTELTPASRRAGLSVLMRRADWTIALLNAIDQGGLKKTDVAVEHWLQLKQNPDKSIARRAEKLAAASGGISTDRQEIVMNLLPLARQPGDLARGKEVFAVNCANCHTFNGQGGKIGPDLTGIGARARAEILTDILDPNRSVEANFRLWNLSTRDGETYSGRLEAETQTSVEILDLTGQNHAIQRKEIAELATSELSIMPNGFEVLPPDDLKGLLEFLTQPH